MNTYDSKQNTSFISVGLYIKTKGNLFMTSEINVCKYFLALELTESDLQNII